MENPDFDLGNQIIFRFQLFNFWHVMDVDLAANKALF